MRRNGVQVKMDRDWKMHRCVLTFSSKPWNWSFYGVVLEMTEKKCTKMQNARADRLYFFIKRIVLWHLCRCRRRCLKSLLFTVVSFFRWYWWSSRIVSWRQYSHSAGVLWSAGQNYRQQDKTKETTARSDSVIIGVFPKDSEKCPIVINQWQYPDDNSESGRDSILL